MNSIRENIIETAAAVFGIARDSLNPHAPWKDYVADSLEVVAFILGVEEAFDVSFDDEEMAALDCLEDLIRAVERKLGDDPAAAVPSGR